MAISSDRALGWRLGRHHLRAGAGSVPEVVRRLGAVPAWSGDPELAVGRRLRRPAPGAVAAALAAGELIKTYAFRGGTYLLAAEDAGTYMAVRGANRQWELPSWQQHYELRPEDWPALRAAVRDAVADGPVTQAELADAVAAVRRFRHLRAGLANRSHTLLKPFAWQGDLCFGPDRDGQATFASPAANPRWTGVSDVDDAGPRAIAGYLAGYGPATPANLRHWLVDGLSAGRRRVDGWLAGMGDAVAEVHVDGEPLLHLREHLDALAGTEPAPAEVTLLPGFDQWVFGPGTADRRVVPAALRSAVTRGANPVLLAGVVAGWWKADRRTLAVTWSAGAARVPAAALDAEAARLAGLLGRELDLAVTTAG